MVSTGLYNSPKDQGKSQLLCTARDSRGHCWSVLRIVQTVSSEAQAGQVGNGFAWE